MYRLDAWTLASNFRLRMQLGDAVKATYMGLPKTCEDCSSGQGAQHTFIGEYTLNGIVVEALSGKDVGAQSGTVVQESSLKVSASRDPSMGVLPSSDTLGRR